MLSRTESEASFILVSSESPADAVGIDGASTQTPKAELDRSVSTALQRHGGPNATLTHLVGGDPAIEASKETFRNVRS